MCGATDFCSDCACNAHGLYVCQNCYASELLECPRCDKRVFFEHVSMYDGIFMCEDCAQLEASEESSGDESSAD